MPRRVYWDSCAFLGLINRESGKLNDCSAVWSEAEKCEGPSKPLSEEEDRKIELLLRQVWIRPVIVDERIGIASRRLMRYHPECKKPSDGIHLATALALSVDEMNTYDRSDLLKLDGKINCADGKPLKICPPHAQPISPVPN